MIEIVPLEPSDYDAVMALWRATEGLTLRDADSRAGLTRYLERNPGLSFVARAESQIVGAVLAVMTVAAAIYTTWRSHQRTEARGSGGH
jgi:predicted N-acetyltransferase YhbS